jgi:hypothetical protein
MRYEADAGESLPVRRRVKPIAQPGKVAHPLLE